MSNNIRIAILKKVFFFFCDRVFMIGIQIYFFLFT